jgi:hypothetical protein
MDNNFNSYNGESLYESSYNDLLNDAIICELIIKKNISNKFNNLDINNILSNDMNNILSNDMNNILSNDMNHNINNYSLEQLKKYIFNCIKCNYLLIKNMKSKIVIDNFEIIKYCVSIDAECICYASNNLQNNIEIATISITKSPYCIKYVGYDIKNNYDLMLYCIEYNGYFLSDVSDILKDNYDIVYEAVKNTPSSLNYASNRLKNNEELLLLACTSNDFEIMSYYFPNDIILNNINIIVFYLFINKNKTIDKLLINFPKSFKQIIMKHFYTIGLLYIFNNININKLLYDDLDIFFKNLDEYSW